MIGQTWVGWVYVSNSKRVFPPQSSQKEKPNNRFKVEFFNKYFFTPTLNSQGG